MTDNLVDENGLITIKPDLSPVLNSKELMNWIIWGNKEGSWIDNQDK